MPKSRSDVAPDLLRLAEADPGKLRQVAREVIQQADGDLAVRSVAERALGVAALHVDGLDVAVRHLQAAMALATRAASPELAAEARIRLAFVRCVQGRPQQALREIDRALPHLHRTGRARAEAQRAVIFNHLFRFGDALATFRVAVPGLRRGGDHVWLQRVLSNRGIAHGYRHEFGAAEADLHEAEQLCRHLDLELSLAIVQYNQGWLHAMRGEVPTALRALDHAEERFRALGTHQVGWLLTDRSELLLSVGLLAESREAAQMAADEFARRGRDIGLPEAQLLLARATYLEGDHAQSVIQAREAASGFIRQGRPAWATLAEFVLLRSRIAEAEHPSEGVRTAERCADALVVAGWPGAAVEARMLAARLALAEGRTEHACRQLELAARSRRRGPAIVRARSWHAAAQLRLNEGDRRGAFSAIRTALRVLDEHRLSMGATDLRAHSARYRAEVAELGLELALKEGHARKVFVCAEQGRASHLLMRPVRPPDDPYLADMLAQLRATIQQIHNYRAAGRGAASLVAQQVALEGAIRDYGRRVAVVNTDFAVPWVSIAGLTSALAQTALVEYVYFSGSLHAVTVVDGRVRMRHLGPSATVNGLLQRVPFALHRLARRATGPGSRSAAAAILRHAAQRLEEILLRPLKCDIGERPLVVVPSGPLQALPWSILPSCVGRSICVSPSAALWQAASGQGNGGSQGMGRGPIIAAAGPGLLGARAEVESVAAIHSAPALVEEAASARAVLAAMDGARLVHVAAHGRLHATNPLFSSLRLADGPLTVYDLEQVRHAPQLVILAACDSGRSVVQAGDELMGLSATFLALGTRTIIASVIPVPDAETATLMVAVHKLLAAGHSAAAALAQAQKQVLSEDNKTPTAAAAAGFVAMGADLIFAD
ncbi:CHAT domain-containing protein [Streptosporangiaceae bacterium NEAU-GS5]|nr:CHAT domain-containing protein [Streptosporangiaceae bacterium NEAU-GS5]